MALPSKICMGTDAGLTGTAAAHLPSGSALRARAKTPSITDLFRSEGQLPGPSLRSLDPSGRHTEDITANMTAGYQATQQVGHCCLSLSILCGTLRQGVLQVPAGAECDAKLMLTALTNAESGVSCSMNMCFVAL